MSPLLLQDDLTDVALAEPESVGYLSLRDRSGQIADLKHFSFGDLGHRMVGSLSIRVSTLRDHISHVVRERAEEEVARPDAGSVVAVMENVHRVRDLLAGRDDPRDAMGIPVLPLDLDQAVALVGDDCRPDPTWSEFWSVLGDWTDTVDLLPESLKQACRYGDNHEGNNSKALNDRTDAELGSIADRLVARGWTIDQVKAQYVAHVMADRVLRVTSTTKLDTIKS